MKEVVICGGGVAGAGLACALAWISEELSVKVLEKSPEEDLGNVKRGEAIRPEVVKVLHEIGVIEYVLAKGPVVVPKPLQEVWHSKKGLIGAIEYDILAKDFPMMYLPHTQFVRSLHDALQRTNVEVIYGAEVRSITDSADRKKINYQKNSTEHELTGDLIVVADGGASSLRNQLGIGLDLVDYNIGYQMVILDRSPDLKAARHCLSPEGFVGLFPMPQSLMRAAVELTPEQLKEWISLGPNEINNKLRARLPYVSELKTSDVGIFYRPIRRQAREFWRKGVILIGDAAHSTHPMLGQGMSMVFNDISVFKRVFFGKADQPGRNEAFLQYEKESKRFSTMIIGNNEKIFRAFRAIGENLDLLKDYLPMLRQVGFREAG
jgi:2-octaprenyl-6-methoxyphenol hydroxylase